jgi:hypothetical protein
MEFVVLGGVVVVVIVVFCYYYDLYCVPPLLNFGANLYACFFFLDVMYLQNTELGMVLYLCLYM